MQRHALGDAGRLDRPVKEAAQMPRCQRTALAAARKDPALTGRNADVVADWPLAPPFAQQYQHLVGQHDVAILAALRLHDADDPLRAVDVTDPEAHHLAGP